MKFEDELKSLKEQILYDKVFDIPENITNIAIAGIGGSGVIGKIFQELYTKVPVVTINSLYIPDHINENTLFIAVSYSGNTKETLDVLGKAEKRGVQSIAITSGGELEKISRNVIKIPSGHNPRCALGYMIAPLLKSFKLISKEEVEEAYNLLNRLDNDNAREKEIADAIAAKKLIPVIYSTPPFASVSYRWKTQFNENAKVFAYASFFPESAHNDMAALRYTYKKKNFYFMALEDATNRDMKKVVDAVEKLTKVSFHRIDAEGSSTFAKMMYLIHVGDYVSYHLATYRKKDPSDLKIVAKFKKMTE